LGETLTKDQIKEEDNIITSIQFNLTGHNLIIGDKSGRIAIFEKINSEITKNSRLDFGYLTEFQANTP